MCFECNDNFHNQPPQKFDLDDLLERMLVIEKIDEALEDAKSGKTVSNEKVKKMVAKWNK